MSSLTYRPLNSPSLVPATLLTMPVFCCRHEHYGQADGRREDPVADVDDFGIAGGTEIQGLDRVADCDVAINAHGAEGEYAGEHVVVVYGDHYLAEDGSERPCSHEVIDTLERQGTGRQGICQSKVEDVDVGGSLHFGVSRKGRKRPSQKETAM